jgi:hypothetical protein
MEQKNFRSSFDYSTETTLKTMKLIDIYFFLNNLSDLPIDWRLCKGAFPS